MSAGGQNVASLAIAEDLAAGAKALGFALYASRLLLEYMRLLAKWNKAYNLTAITDPEEMVTHHLLDSLAVLTYLLLQKKFAQRVAEIRDLEVGQVASRQHLEALFQFCLHRACRCEL